MQVDGLAAETIGIELLRGVRDGDTFIETIAGTGSHGFSGDGGPATDAEFRLPRAVAIDNSGIIYIADSGNMRIRRLDTDGTITLVAGDGTIGLIATTDEQFPNPGIRVDIPDGSNGPAIDSRVANPLGLAFLPNGCLLVGEFSGQKVRRIEFDGLGFIREFAGLGVAAFGGDGGPASEANLHSPAGITVDGLGNVYIAEQFNFRVRRVAPDGTIATVAGSSDTGFGGEGSEATDARLNQPTGVAVDAAGNLYIADQANSRVRRVGTDGLIQTIAGTGEFDYGGDGGPAIFAQLNEPRDVAIDATNRLYVSDSGNDRVRVIDLDTGVIQSVAGSGASGSSGSQGTALSFSLDDPSGLAVSPDSSLLVADTGNDRILRLRINNAGQSSPVEPLPGGTILGDFTGDDRVDFHDFLLFAPAFGTSGDGFDLDGDSYVGFTDFLVFAQAFSTD